MSVPFHHFLSSHVIFTFQVSSVVIRQYNYLLNKWPMLVLGLLVLA